MFVRFRQTWERLQWPLNISLRRPLSHHPWLWWAPLLVDRQMSMAWRVHIGGVIIAALLQLELKNYVGLRLSKALASACNLGRPCAFFNFPNGSCFIHFSRYFFKNLKILKNSKIFPKKLWFKGHVENQKIAISYLGLKMALVWEYFQKFIHFGQRKRPYGRLKESGKIVLTEFVIWVFADNDTVLHIPRWHMWSEVSVEQHSQAHTQVGIEELKKSHLVENLLCAITDVWHTLYYEENQGPTSRARS